MKRFFALILLFVASCALAAKQPAIRVSEYLWVSGFPDLPPDARRVAERLAACSHFSGEFNGDLSERDKEVTAAMTELRCETIEQDASAIRKKYASNSTVEDALVAASQL